jgi:hypothetical protein
MLRQYLIRVGSAASQLANVIFLGGHPNESVSGRSYRCGWRIERAIDLVFGRGHCKASYVQDATDAVNYLYEFQKHDAH